ncbi:MAG: RHS repeat-associated core domain-containing protein [Chlamydiia bacterium]|nr:RHS repeat-associated core domain-containing protein [Chlamydiia bacterium]
MKIILVFIASFLFQFGHAALPESSFSVDLTTGKWMESAKEDNTLRVWKGKTWEFTGEKSPAIYHFAEKQLVKVTPSSNKAPIVYSYDAKGRLVKREEGDKHFLELVLDDKGRVVEERAPLGKDATPIALSRFNYLSGRTEVIDPYGLKKIYYYNEEKQVTKLEHYDENGLYKTDTFKWEGGELKKQTLLDKEGNELLVQKNVFGSSGRLKEQIIIGDLTGRGQKETFTQKYHYDSQGVLEKVVGDDGIVLATPTPKTTGSETVVQNRSDGLPELKTLPNGEGESYEWDQYGNLIARTTSKDGGKRVTFTYDFMNRLIKESDGFGFEYDYLGRQTKQIDPDGNETEFVYDAMGRVIEKIDPEVLDPEGRPIRPRTQFKYNELDQLIETIDPDGFSTQIHYTARGQISRIEHPDGRIEEIFYQRNGLKEGEVPQEPELQLPEIEPLPLPTPTEEDPTQTLKVINDRGQQVMQKIFVDFLGIKSVKTFDALGRLERVEKYNLLGELFLSKEIRYTLAGIKAFESVNGETTDWEWGPGEKLKSVTENKGTAKERVTRYLYDDKGRLTHFIKPSGLTLSYSYDENGALIGLKSSDHSVEAAFIWNAEGRLVEAINQKTGKSTYRTYDEKGKLVEETLENGLKVVFEKDSIVLPDRSRIVYRRNEEGILQSVIREDKEGKTLYTHTYNGPDSEEMILGLGSIQTLRDKEERIVSITSPYREEKLHYDGFLLKSVEVDGKAKTFEYDAELRLKGKEKADPELDLDGNTIHANGRSLNYDAMGRLIDVDGTFLYEYDVFGRRISRTTAHEKILYLWDKMDEIGALSPEGTIKELKVIGSKGAVTVELDGTPYAALLDAKGSIAKLISPTSEAKSPWTYQGKREDAETGFIYFGARFLNPESGRFLTPDPKGYVDGRDLHQFARYNPNLFSDQWGHTAIMDGFKSLASTGWNAWLRLQSNLTEWREWLNNLSGMQYLHSRMEDLATLMLGKGFLIQSGYWHQERQTGVYGEGEINDKVRITFNHGILNIRSDLADNLRQISLAHGGNNVHYVYRPTGGFAWDLVKCMMVKNGYLSPEAKELIRIWRGLIEEMGGVDGGGKIIHYAHSVGGTDTFNALAHLSTEEQRMLDIRTFGSATLIPDINTYQVTNYVSKRDGVSMFDPLHYFPGLFVGDPTIIFVGSIFGIPLCDHPLSVDSYQLVIRTLGQAFLEAYSG